MHPLVPKRLPMLGAIQTQNQKVVPAPEILHFKNKIRDKRWIQIDSSTLKKTMRPYQLAYVSQNSQKKQQHQPFSIFL